MDDEFARIASIRTILERRRDDISIGIGDDAAVLFPSPSAQAVSVDVQVENVHFRRGWLSFEDLGHRAYHAAASDLAAMGARPRASLLSLILPPAVSDDELFALVRGVAAAADDVGAHVIGGNLSGGSEISVTTTVMGELGEARLSRSGAKVGDAVYVTGTVGGAALGVAALEANAARDPRYAPFLARYRRPKARIDDGLALLEDASAAADVSDGLLADLRHICDASGVGASIETARLPHLEGFADACASLDRDPLRLGLAGGEDFELVFTGPEGPALDRFGTRIGRIVSSPEVTCSGPDGRPLARDFAGFNHF